MGPMGPGPVGPMGQWAMGHGPGPGSMNQGRVPGLKPLPIDVFIMGVPTSCFLYLSIWGSTPHIWTGGMVKDVCSLPGIKDCSEPVTKPVAYVLIARAPGMTPAIDPTPNQP